jgi:hypothetical protein
VANLLLVACCSQEAERRWKTALSLGPRPSGYNATNVFRDRGLVRTDLPEPVCGSDKSKPPVGDLKR